MFGCVRGVRCAKTEHPEQWLYLVTAGHVFTAGSAVSQSYDVAVIRIINIIGIFEHP